MSINTNTTNCPKRLKQDPSIREDYRTLDSVKNKAQSASYVSSSERRIRHLPLRQANLNQSSNNCFVQIYGTGFDTGETIATVLLFFDQHRFIFNVGEGIQRFCTEHRIKLSKIDHIFLTRICAETAGGLPGLLLTLAGINETGMTAQIWGPGNFHNLVNAIRRFVPNAATVHTHSFGSKMDQKVEVQNADGTADMMAPDVLFQNEAVKICAVILHPSVEGDTHASKESTRVSVLYICELAEVVGKFDPKKALAKGLKPGPKYGKLQRGESVLSDDGTQQVNPEEVLSPSSPGPIMMLVDCPSLHYLHALNSTPRLQMYYSGSRKHVNCIVHLSPPSVTKHEGYRKWMANFKDAHHLMAGRDRMNPQFPILKSSAFQLSKLNYMCPKVFPVTGYLPAQDGEMTVTEPDTMLKTTLANNLMKYRLRPISALGLDCSAIPENFNFLTAQEEFSKERSHVSEAKEHLSRTWAAMEEEDSGIQDIHDSEIVPECVMQAGRHELEIVFLGTGSSQPSKYRNVSGIYLHLFERGGILLDCGEGTYAQLKRRYGSDGADDILRNLKCIWISHIHADHHAGLPRLLSARKRLIVDKPLLVIGPKQLRGFLNAYEMVEELGMVFLDCSQTTIAAEAAAKALEMDRCTMSGGDDSLSNLPSEAVARSESDKLMQENGIHLQQGVDIAGRRILNCILRSMGLRNLRSVHVVHCHNAYGIVLESDPIPMDDGSLREGWKVVYSGDTRPCPALVDASKGATVLIHEATFDDSKPMEAIAKNHSITKEAIEVGMTAGVYRIILTHFSQRYPKIPVLSGSYTNKTCIAFDMMSVNIADLPLLPRLLPAFKMLFQDEMSLEDEDDQESYVPDSADSLLL